MKYSKQLPIIFSIFLLGGQRCVLHLALIVELPAQGRPPNRGPIQTRLLIFVPPLHVFVHRVYPPHDAHLPWTKGSKIDISN